MLTRGVLLFMEEPKPNSSRACDWVAVVVVLCVIGLLLLIAIPNFVGRHRYSPMNTCINNLRQIDAAKQQWALESNQTNSDTIVGWKNVKPYLGRGAQGSLTNIFCPLDQTKWHLNSYRLGALNGKPLCKISPTNHFTN